MSMRASCAQALDTMQHIRTGQYGEVLAKNWLRRNGFAILLTNWRCGRYEIDIVASKKNIIHCIEVKTMRGSQYGNPEDKISRSKYHNLLAATVFLMEYTTEEVQVDILSIVIGNGAIEFFLIEDIGWGNQR